MKSRRLRIAAATVTAALAAAGLAGCSDKKPDTPQVPSSELSESASASEDTEDTEDGTKDTTETESTSSGESSEDASEDSSSDHSSQGAANNKDTSDDAAAPDPSEFVLPPLTSDGFPELNSAREIVDTRIGFHEGYERFVIEFSDPAPGMNDALPEYSLEYDRHPVWDGSGLPIEYKGHTALMVVVSGVSIPSDPSDESAFQPLAGRDGSVIQEVIPSGPFEGMSQSVIGVDRERPIKVSMLKDPVRLVIDISTAD